MALVTDTTLKIFDLSAVNRGDCIRIRRNGDLSFKNGLVTKISEKELQILYSNTQNNSTSYLSILAPDVAAGIWEIFWTSDFHTVNYEFNAAPES